MRMSVKVSAPAVLSGIIGVEGLISIALDMPGDEVTLRRTEQSTPRVTTRATGGNKGDKEQLSRAVTDVIHAYFRKRGGGFGIEANIQLRKPYSGALGGSIPALVAALCAIDFIFTDRLDTHELLPIALETAKQYTNAPFSSVSAAFFGGITMDAGLYSEPLRQHKVFVPQGIHIAMTGIPTSSSSPLQEDRLTSQSELRTTAQNAAAFVLGGMTGDWTLFKQAFRHVTNDLTEEVQRLYLSCMKAGAIGGGIAPSPTANLLYLLCDNSSTAEDIAHIMEQAYPPSRKQIAPLISNIHPSGHVIF